MTFLNLDFSILIQTLAACAALALQLQFKPGALGARRIYESLKLRLPVAL